MEFRQRLKEKPKAETYISKPMHRLLSVCRKNPKQRPDKGKAKSRDPQQRPKAETQKRNLKQIPESRDPKAETQAETQAEAPSRLPKQKPHT